MDLAKAEPALLAAQEALDTLNKVGEGKMGGGDTLGCEVGPFISDPCAFAEQSD